MLTILKLFLLVVAIVYTFSNFGKLLTKQTVHSSTIWIMAVSVVAFVYLQFGI